MANKTIENEISSTAKWTTMSRAASYLESNPNYHSGDFIAPLLLPTAMHQMMRVPGFSRMMMRLATPVGVYEYIIARTRFIDAAFIQAVAQGFRQALIFGAGFDSRALRFGQGRDDGIMTYELDAPVTQQAKLKQYDKRGISVPPNVRFVPINFDREDLRSKLQAAGFRHGKRSLFILEGLLMYLQPDSVDETFNVIREYAGSGSEVVFDYVRAGVLRREGRYYGEKDIYSRVAGAGEPWQFGFEDEQVAVFLGQHGMRLVEQKTPQDMERDYFTDGKGRRVGRVNGTHCLVKARKD